MEPSMINTEALRLMSNLIDAYALPCEKEARFKLWDEANLFACYAKPQTEEVRLLRKTLIASLEMEKRIVQEEAWVHVQAMLDRVKKK